MLSFLVNCSILLFSFEKRKCCPEARKGFPFVAGLLTWWETTRNKSVVLRPICTYPIGIINTRLPPQGDGEAIEWFLFGCLLLKS